MDIKAHFDIYAKFISDEMGYGVFSNEYIPKNSIIETTYCVPINPNEDWKDYKFSVSKFNVFMPLGFGVIYNHSDSNNIKWKIIDDRLIQFYSIKDIRPREELCHNYGENYWKSIHKKKSKKKLI